MGLTVNTNIASLDAISNLNSVQGKLQKTLSRISSGVRITRAGDDAAGLGVAENLASAHMSLRMAMRNTNDGISVVQTAEGAASEISNILKRMRELAIQSASDTLATGERAYVQDEFTALGLEIDRIAAATSFNGVALTDGVITQLDVQVGIDGTANSRITINLANMDQTALTVNAASLSTAALARTALTNIDAALDTVNSTRSDFGAAQNRLEAAYRQADNYFLNLRDSESRIRDTDYAEESAQMSKYQIMQQSGVAVLSQARGMNASAAQLISN